MKIILCLAAGYGFGRILHDAVAVFREWRKRRRIQKGPITERKVPKPEPWPAPPEDPEVGQVRLLQMISEYRYLAGQLVQPGLELDDVEYIDQLVQQAESKIKSAIKSLYRIAYARPGMAINEGPPPPPPNEKTAFPGDLPGDAKLLMKAYELCERNKE